MLALRTGNLVRCNWSHIISHMHGMSRGRFLLHWLFKMHTVPVRFGIGELRGRLVCYLRCRDILCIFSDIVP